jgi:DNA-binding LytR/AlgR family response regulator
MQHESIRTLIVHDEASTRKRLRGLLAQEAGVEIVAECDSAHLALRILTVQGAELLFLKASLPGADQLQRLGRSSQENAPAIVLLPSRIEAEQENGSLDDDHLRAILRATRSPALQPAENPSSRPLAEASERYSPRLTIEQDRRIMLLDVHQIHWIDALGNYVKINCSDRTFTLRETMKSLGN